MLPAFQEGRVVIVNRLSYFNSRPSVDDIIVLRDPRTGREILKRITSITSSGYFVEGDNKKESTDSNTFGSITRNQIIGKVL